MRPTAFSFGEFLVCGLMFLGMVAGAAVAAADQDEVIARCGTEMIRRADVDMVLGRLGLSELPEGEQRQRAAAAVLEQIIDERVLRAEVARAGVVVKASEIEAALVRLEEQVAVRGQDFATFLAQTGRTPESIREQVSLEIGLDKIVGPLITADAIARVFEENRRELDGTRLRVSHIILRPAAGGDGDLGSGLIEQAGVIRREIIQGRVSFGEAAGRHSAGPSRRQGGDLGWIAREGPMIDAFTSEAFTLSKGAVSEPFLTPFGVHLVTVTAVEPGGVGLDGVRSRLEKMLANQVVRGLVTQGRGRMPVAVAAGVPHFDPTTFQSPAARRAVIMAQPADEPAPQEPAPQEPAPQE